MKLNLVVITIDHIISYNIFIQIMHRYIKRAIKERYLYSQWGWYHLGSAEAKAHWLSENSRYNKQICLYTTYIYTLL